jgi:hypothetical protein
MKRNHFLMTLILGGILLVWTGNRTAIASVRDNPPPLPGFTHSPLFTPDDSLQGHGILLAGASIVRGSPVIAEIDGNTQNGKEIALGGPDGRLYVYKSNGSLLWSKNVLTSGCSLPTGDGLVNSAPAVGQLFGDGVPYVVVGYGTILQSNCDGGVVAYRGSDGLERWRYSLSAVSPTESLHGVISSPALADTDGDGKLEVGFGGFDRNVHLLNADGTVRWRYHAADTVWSSPAFVNVDTDDELELVIGTDISANPSMVPPTLDGGYVYAFDTQARNPVNIPFRTGFVWQTYLDQAIYSSPAIGDVLPSNSGVEIVIGGGCFFPANSTNKTGKWVKILRPGDGLVLQTLNASACLRSSPALGDIDDDGKLEVVATVTGATEFGGDGRSHVVAWDPDTGAQKWVATPTDPNSGSNDPHGDDLQSPVIADVDGNGSLEVIVANFWSVHILNGKTGAPLTCQNPSCGSVLSLFAWFTLKSTPAIGDVDADGDLEVVIGGGHIYSSGRGLLYAWTDFAAAGLGSPAGNQPPYSAPWPMFRGNSQHTGNFNLGDNPVMSVTPSSYSVMHAVTDPSSESFVLKILNTGGAGSINWNVAPPSGVTVNPSSGALTTSAQTVVTISMTGKPLGINTLGNIVVTGTSGGKPVGSSPTNVPITLYMAEQLFKLNLPLIRR